MPARSALWARNWSSAASSRSVRVTDRFCARLFWARSGAINSPPDTSSPPVTFACGLGSHGAEPRHDLVLRALDADRALQQVRERRAHQLLVEERAFVAPRVLDHERLARALVALLVFEQAPVLRDEAGAGLEHRLHADLLEPEGDVLLEQRRAHPCPELFQLLLGEAVEHAAHD